MNVLVTTVCNDPYTNALCLLMWSIKQHNPGFSHPLKVYHKGDLSEANQERIRSVYPQTSYENVSSGDYQAKICHYLALEAFRETDPDLVVFIDGDIVCLGDISALFKLNCPLGAALDYDFRFKYFFNARFPFSPLARINTGVFVLNKTYRTGATYDALYAMLREFPDTYVKGMAWSDQGIMNRYFRMHPKLILPYYYNARKNFFKNQRFAQGEDVALRGVRLLHFCGAYKPCLGGGLKNLPPNYKHHRYSKTHEVYYRYWDRMVAELRVDWKLD